MDETLRALEERAKEYRKDPVDIAMLKASRERKRDAVGSIGLSGNIRITNSKADHKTEPKPKAVPLPTSLRRKGIAIVDPATATDSELESAREAGWKVPDRSNRGVDTTPETAFGKQTP